MKSIKRIKQGIRIVFMGLLLVITGHVMSYALDANSSHNWGFEDGTLEGWTPDGEGTAFDNQPTYGPNMSMHRVNPELGATMESNIGGDYHDAPYPNGFAGSYWIGIHEDRHTPQDEWGKTRENVYGRLISPAFVLDRDFIHFKLGGTAGSADGNYIRLDVCTQPEEDRCVQVCNEGECSQLCAPAECSETSGTWEIGAKKTWRTASGNILRREVMEVAGLKGNTVRLVIEAGKVGDDNNANFAVDDIWVTDSSPDDYYPNDDVAAQKERVWGFADTHTHPMANLGFGEYLMWGDPRDIDSENVLYESCGAGEHKSGSMFAARYMIADLEDSLYWGRKVEPQDILADQLNKILPDVLPKIGSGIVPHERRDVVNFTKWYNVTHQQMYLRWIRRAYEGGLRLLVAEASNNRESEYVLSGEAASDTDSARRQLQAMRSMAADNSDWMEIATSPAQARRIIHEGKLAIVLGVEVDSFADCDAPHTHPYRGTVTPWDTRPCTSDELKNKLNEYYYELGVRQVHTVHLTDNGLAGAAVYNDAFNIANWFLNDEFMQVRPGNDPDKQVFWHFEPRQNYLTTIKTVGWSFQDEMNLAVLTACYLTCPNILGVPDPFCLGGCTGTGALYVAGALEALPNDPIPWAYPYNPYDGAYGMVNARGLQPQGQDLIDKLKNRGMIIAVDHMSERTLDKVIGTSNPYYKNDGVPAIAGSGCDNTTTSECQEGAYPVIMSHSALRDAQFTPSETPNKGKWKSEAGKREDQVQQVYNIGGVVSYGTAPGDARAHDGKGESQSEYVLMFDDEPDLNNTCAGSSRSFYQAYKRLFSSWLNDTWMGAEREKQQWGFALPFGSDFNGLAGAANPRFGDEACWGRTTDSSESKAITSDDPQFLREGRTAYAQSGRQEIGVNYDYYDTTPPSPSLHMQVADNPPLKASTLKVSLPGLGYQSKTWIINTDGVAHYGMLPDFLQDLRAIGLTKEQMGPFFNGAEAYLQMWEKAEGMSDLSEVIGDVFTRGGGISSNYYCPGDQVDFSATLFGLVKREYGDYYRYEGNKIEVKFGPVRVAFYLSTDTDISNSDIYLGSTEVRGWVNGEMRYEWSGNLPTNLSPGVYYFGWIVDPSNVIAESDETDNTGSILVTIRDSSPPSAPTAINYPSEVYISSSGSHSVSWPKVEGAFYTLQRRAGNSGSWETLLMDFASHNVSCGDTTCSYWNYTSSLPDGTYYYRVRANTICSSSDWRTGGAMVVDALPDPAVKLSPADGATDVPLHPDLRWEHDVDGEAGGRISYQKHLTPYYYSYPLQDGTTYSWSVDVINNLEAEYTNGRSGTTSDGTPWSFTTCSGPAAAPANPFPANGASDLPRLTVLNWGAVAGATSYTVYLSSSDSAISSTVSAPSFDPGPLEENTSYRWGVKANNYCVSKGSAPWYFRTETEHFDCSQVIPIPREYERTVIYDDGYVPSGVSKVSDYKCASCPDCPGRVEAGEEKIYSFTTLLPGTLRADLSNWGGSHMAYLLSACDPDSCLAYESGLHGASVHTQPGVSTYYIAVDSLEGKEGSYTLVLDFEADAATAYGETLYKKYDFADGAQGWQAGGLWHLVDENTPCSRVFSPTQAWRYGQFDQEIGCNYDDGMANKGALISPPIDLSHAYGSISLYFWSWEETENAADKDTRKVYISSDNGSTWTQIYQSADNSAAWHEVLIDISSYHHRQVQFKFEFDAVTDQNNRYMGWYLDDVSILVKCLETDKASNPLPGKNVRGVSPDTALDWDDALNALSYQVYLGTSYPLDMVATVTGSRYQPPQPLAKNTKYFWKIEPVDNCGKTRQDAVTWEFTTCRDISAAPDNLSPSDNANGIETVVTLDWSDVSGADSYEIYLDTNASLDSADLLTTVTQSTYKLESLAKGATYFWKIVAKGCNRMAGEEWRFTTCSVPALPAKSSPQDKAADVSLSADLSWNAVGGAWSYRIYFGTVSPPPYFAGIVADQQSYDPGGLLPNTTYYWNVTAKNKCGESLTTDTDIRSFTTCAPPPVPNNPWPGPGEANIPLKPLLTWSATGDSYSVDFGTDGHYWVSANVSTNSLDIREYLGSGALIPGQTYNWRVRAIKACGSSSQMSAAWTFTACSLPAVSWTPQPSTGAVFVPLNTNLDWADVPGATSYEVYFGTDESSLPLLGTVSQSDFDLAALSINTIYYWRIGVHNGCGYSEGNTWSFTTTGGDLDCSNAVPLTCGAPYSGTTTGATSSVTTYNCVPAWNMSGREVVHTITTTQPGDIKATLTKIDDPNTNPPGLIPFILSACDRNACIEFGSPRGSVQYLDAPPGTYYIVVDGMNGASGDYKLTVECGSKYTAVYKEDFEGDTSGWQMDGLWHLVEQGVSPYPEAYSPTHAFWYGQDATGNYDTGAANSGALISPEIDLTGVTGRARLRLRSWDQSECTDCSSDYGQVYISENNGATWNFFMFNRKNNTSSWIDLCPPFDLSNDGFGHSYTGKKIRLKFVFTANGTNDNYRGWYIDDVTIEAECSDPNPSLPDYSWPANGERNLGLNPLLHWEHYQAPKPTSCLVYFGTTFPLPLVAAVDYDPVMGASYNPGILAENTQYFWKIVGKGCGNTEGPLWNFTTCSLPSVIADNPVVPDNGTTNVPMLATLDWDDVDDTASYDVDVYVGDSSHLWCHTTVSASQAQVGLVPGYQFFWQVTAGNACGTRVSPLWSFRSCSNYPYPPNNPYLNPPYNGATGIAADNPVLKWKDVAAATEYEVYFATNTSFSGELWAKVFKSSCDQGVCSYKPGILANATQYFWQVKAKNDCGEALLHSVWSFTTCAGSFETCDGLDNNCNGQIDEGFADSDGDGVADCADNCPLTANPDQSNSDGQGGGDVCDACPGNPDDNCDPNRSIAASIGANGGSLVTPDGSVSLEIPAGALVAASYISITDSGQGSLYQIVTDSGQNGAALYGVVLGPEGQTFNSPVTLAFSWKDDNNDGVIDGTLIAERNLRIAKDNQELTAECQNETGPLSPAAAECNQAGNTFRIQISSFSEFVLYAADDDQDGAPNETDNCPAAANPNQADADNDSVGDACDTCTDADRDGFGGVNYPANTCPADCDDANPLVHPAAAEVCDGADNDCNPNTPDGVSEVWLNAPCDGVDTDLCNEGVSQCLNGVQTCTDTTGNNPEVCDGLDNDCNPATPDGAAEPWMGNACDGADADLCEEGAYECINGVQACSDNSADNPEICDGLDNDCNGQIDEGVKHTYYRDADGDGYGNPQIFTQACTAPVSYVSDDTDCDDNNVAVNPATTWYKDADGDKYSDGTSKTQCARPVQFYPATELLALVGDCDDTNPNFSPATVWYQDIDKDKYSTGATQTQCTQPPDYYLAANMIATTGDCDDTKAGINPKAAEVCDGLDNNCNGQTDEGGNVYYRDEDADSYGDPDNSIWTCAVQVGYVSNNADCNDTDPLINPETVWYKDSDRDKYSDGTTLTQCRRPASFYLPAEITALLGDCNDSNEYIHPARVEVCDGRDNNCNGQVDEGAKNTYYQDGDGDGHGNPLESLQACFPSQGYVGNNTDCDDSKRAINPVAPEICGDEVDNNCDESIDEAGCLACPLYVPDNFSTIQGAIDAAYNGCEIVVRAGTYPENLNFLGKAVTVRSESGAAGTIIDGGASGSVVTFASGESATSVLDGFTLTNGSGTPNGEYAYGGGIYCLSASPVITNCTIHSNTALNGGGIYCSKSSPDITDCAFNDNAAQYGAAIYCDNSSPVITRGSMVNNSASSYGGGLYCRYSSPAITDCTISGNSAATNGGGIAGDYSSLALSRCNISRNLAGLHGGGLFCRYNSSSTITNCIVSDNNALYGGGLYCTDASSPVITNCTISNNSSYNRGGGIRCYDSSPVALNSILWGNIGAGISDEIYLDGAAANITVSYSDIQGGWPGTGNIGEDLIAHDPRFVGSGNYHLTLASPCIDSGTGVGAPVADMDGDDRPQMAGYDMGADELVCPDQSDSDGDGIGNVCDACPHDAVNDSDGDGICGDLDNCPNKSNPGQTDSDGDGIGDACDNCTLVKNSNQRNTNNDGYGNICDPDINNDCYVNTADLAALKAAFGTCAGSTKYNQHADFTGDNCVNTADLAILKKYFGKQPGPGLGSCH
ncbi:MAG: thrombospondin type 3 repeat-containing protein [Candidatus Schekmanbacteria bacterium]|nr:thrombospondin type 3 repeat-containing protein [Candidatus Schekmanbacteria bacterium]